MSLLTQLGDYFEHWLLGLIIFITNLLPVKVIRDERGTPFLYRYHIFSLWKDGPGLCIHHFVKSDPERGYHDHPWNHALSFILTGGYQERILDLASRKEYSTLQRPRWTFNYLHGRNVFHRVMIEPNKSAWTIFAFGSRKKVWGMISLDGEYHQMSASISDQDGGWWHTVGKGYGIDNHVEHPGKVIATADAMVIARDTNTNKLLLIQRGKEPFKDHWAFPGGRIEKQDPDILTAAQRELQEETQLSVEDAPLEYFTTVGNNHRDPRGFCLTNVFTCQLPEIPDNVRAGDDAVNYGWFPVDELPAEMAFDHRNIFNQFQNTKLPKSE